MNMPKTAQPDDTIPPTSDQTAQTSVTSPSGSREKETLTANRNAETVDLKVADKIAREEKDEYWETFGHEIELEKEIAELGVEKVENGAVKLPEDVAEEMGIAPTVTIETPIHEAVPGFSARGVVLTDETLSFGKAQPTTKSFRWLTEWFIYELLKGGFIVKLIKGKIQREKK